MSKAKEDATAMALWELGKLALWCRAQVDDPAVSAAVDTEVMLTACEALVMLDRAAARLPGYEYLRDARR